MTEFVYQKTSKSDLLFSKDVKLEKEFLEEGSKDLYDIIKFCCAVKENPISPNLKEWSRKEYTSDLASMVYNNSNLENSEYDEHTNRGAKLCSKSSNLCNDGNYCPKFWKWRKSSLECC